MSPTGPGGATVEPTLKLLLVDEWKGVTEVRWLELFPVLISGGAFLPEACVRILLNGATEAFFRHSYYIHS